MSTETRFTPGPWCREDATVYTSQKDGVNRFQAWFTRGFNDNGQRIGYERAGRIIEVEETLRAIDDALTKAEGKA